MNFNPDDVRKVAQAVLSLEPYLVECRSDYSVCHFCDAKQGVGYADGMEVGEKFLHDLNCPVLVAKDLLA